MSSEVSIIGIVGVPAKYGGFETLAENLVANKDQKFLVYCESRSYKKRFAMHQNARLVYVPIKANGVQSVFYDMASIFHSLVTNNNNLLVLGVSGAICFPLVRLISNRKIIVNIDGLEWKREKWGILAKNFLKFSEKIAVKFAHEVISDNQAIFEYVKNQYRLKSHVIAYGGDHAVTEKVALNKKNFFLALCRCEPENNVEIILDAFSKTGEKLIFVSNWSSNKYARKLKQKYSNHNNIDILNPIYDQEKLFKLRSTCSGYIHGHSAGGTNPSLVEMMHMNVNIFCFDCSYNRQTTQNMAHYFHDGDHLKKLINDDIPSNGDKMKEIAIKNYCWESIKNKYFQLLN